MTPEKKSKFLYALIYCAIAIGVPSIIGIPLTASLSLPPIVEASYIIVGVISIMYGIFRSHFRDSRNYKKNKTVIEDKNTKEYQDYRFRQWTAYLAGLTDLLLSLVAYLICLNIYYK